MLLFYATRDGQARRIAERIAGWLAETGTPASPRDLNAGLPDPAELTGVVVVVAAVRYGKHLPQAERLFPLLHGAAQRVRLVLLSVNLTARKPGKDTVAGNRYLQKTIARHRLQPVLAAAVAGRLDYQRYSWRDRLIIRFIMKLTGGPTDPTACVEFTDWHSVDVLAARIAQLSGRQAQQ